MRANAVAQILIGILLASTLTSVIAVRPAQSEHETQAAFSGIDATELFVSALAEGVAFTATSTGTYRFTITSGACEVCPPNAQPDHPEWWGWKTQILIYKNRPIEWDSAWPYSNPASWDFSVGDPALQSTYSTAEEIGRGMFIDVPLWENDYVILVANDAKGCFFDNSGGIRLSVTVQTSYVIVHAHNPEGVEIASIEGMSSQSVEIFDGDTLVGYGAYGADTHNKPIAIVPGDHTIKAKFNGMTLEQNVNIYAGQTQVLTFTFERTHWDGTLYGNSLAGDYYSEISGSFDGYYPDTWVEDITIDEARQFAKTSVRFACSHDWQAGVFHMIATMSIDYSPGNFSISASAYNWVGFTRGGHDVGVSPHNHALAWLLNLPNPFPSEEGSCFLVQRIDTFTTSYDFSQFHFQVFAYADAITRHYNANHPVIISTVPYDLAGTGIEDGENQPPIASFTYSPEKPMVGGNITFTSTSSDPDGEIISYEWDFGDGTTISTETFSCAHIYESPAECTVVLTVTDSNGLTSSTSSMLDLSLRNGDLLLCRSKWSMVPGFWTHVGIYHQPSNMVIEARPSGVAFYPLSDWFYPRQTCVEALRVNTDQHTRNAAVTFAWNQVGCTYDLLSILLNVKGLDDSDGLGWYCSELVWAAYVTASDNLVNLDADMFAVSPDEINLDDDVTFVGTHIEEIPHTVGSIILWGRTRCPVDLSIADPHGLVLNKQSNEIPGAIYEEVDIDEDGDFDDFFIILEPELGDYSIQVFPEFDALPVDTYSLEVTLYGNTVVLAEDTPITSIPIQPYIIRLAETEMIQITPILGDVNGDNRVDIRDVALAGKAFGTYPGHPRWNSPADMNKDGKIDIRDLALISKNFGKTYP